MGYIILIAISAGWLSHADCVLQPRTVNIAFDLVNQSFAGARYFWSWWWQKGILTKDEFLSKGSWFCNGKAWYVKVLKSSIFCGHTHIQHFALGESYGSRILKFSISPDGHG